MTAVDIHAVLDLAALGVVSDGPIAADALCRHVQGLCRPWLAPTTCVIARRLEFAIDSGLMVADAERRLRLTEAGRARLGELLLAPAAATSHGLLPLMEALKLALVDDLEASARERVLRELLSSRDLCAAAQSARGATAPAIVRRFADRRSGLADRDRKAIERELDRVEAV